MLTSRLGRPESGGAGAPLFVLALMCWVLHYYQDGELRAWFVAGTVAFGACGVLGLFADVMIPDPRDAHLVRRRRSTRGAAGGVLLLGMAVAGVVLVRLFDLPGSLGGQIPALANFGNGLIWLVGGLGGLFSLIALWPATRCPVCSSRRCVCYEKS